MRAAVERARLAGDLADASEEIGRLVDGSDAAERQQPCLEAPEQKNPACEAITELKRNEHLLVELNN